MTDVDHYGALGVDPGADLATIRAAHRAAVKRHHPDIGGDPERFRQIQRAWEVLGSEDSRALYDAERAATARTSSRQGPYQPGAARPGANSYFGEHRPGRPSPGSRPPGTEDPIAARRRHALSERARLDALWAKLEADDAYIGELRALWRTRLSELDRLEVRRRHTETVDAAAGHLAEAQHLAELLGVDPEAWPELPNLSALAGPPDELGFDNTPRVWFVEPWDLLSGPLWMRPSLSLRARSALWAAVATVVFVLVRRAGLAGFGFDGTPTTEATASWSSEVSVLAAAGVAAAVGAVAWPVLLTVGLIRRSLAEVGSRHVRCIAAGAAVAAVAAGEWWTRPLVGVLWVLAGAVGGVAVAAARPVLAALWVRWWTATVGARIEEWRRDRRRARGPRQATRRARRRARL